MSLRQHMRYMNPYDVHKALINEYVLRRPGDTRFLQRDTSKDRKDVDIVKENHRFLWNDDDKPMSWEEEFARKYYDKLFKEYCIGDLSRYKENKIALRWRIEREVVAGKGQFTCGNKICDKEDELKSWEVNFAYMEKGEKRNALVKIRLCLKCSKKLNHHSKKKEIKRLKKKSKIKSKSTPDDDETVNNDNVSGSSSGIDDALEINGDNVQSKIDESPWVNLKPIETKTREEEMEDYLEDLLL
ncbi:acid phosphatase-related [Holotrichia oblita]|uniref:Acid phosphatase-related n=1 Tax=Holotrichia oblita TaxID=644536 RepID=A0ACB9T095_HOLOL|nr:acid phosphatase-related [Holotrichia oblita]